MSTYSARRVGRRWFLTQTGRGALGIAVVGLSACTRSGYSVDEASVPGSSGSAPDTDELAWSRVDLGFVSAYVLVRGREAAVVDTGVEGSEDQIGVVLRQAGPGWAGVRHVVLTHKHGDHAGSLSAVADRAPSATLYAGAPDVSALDAPRPVRTVADDDDVFGLRIVASPGHTAGHVAVFDEQSRVLVAGDALTNTDGLAGSNPQFTEDADAARASVRKLAGLEPRVILV